MILDGTILNADVNASAAIAGTKISPDFGSQNIVTTGTNTAARFIPSGSTVPTNGLYLPSANNVGLATNSTLQFLIDSNGNQYSGATSGLGTAVTCFYNQGSSYVSGGQTTELVGRWRTGVGDNNGSGNVGIDFYRVPRGGGVQSGAEMRFYTGYTYLGGTYQRMVLDQNGYFGVGTLTPATLVEASSTTGTRIRSSYTNTSGGRDAGFEIYGDVSGTFASRASLVYAGNSGVTTLSAALDLAVNTNGSERARIDSSGRLLVGTSSARSVATQNWGIQQEGTTFSNTGISTVANRNDTYGSYLVMGKTRGTSVGAVTAVVNGDDYGSIIFCGGNGTNVDTQAALITASVDGSTISTSSMPGRLTFFTTPSGSSSPTERLRVDSNGFASHTGAIGRGAPVTKTGAFTVGIAENWLICNGTASITVTLPAASAWTGREIMLKTIAAFTVISASSNVVPLAGGAAGTAILAATAGKYATLVSDGTNWIIMQAN
jgi:hypothetical protein